MKNEKNEKVIIFHGFTGEELEIIIKILRKDFPDYKNTILATTTETSLEWKLKELIKELIEEREYFKKQTNKNS